MNIKDLRAKTGLSQRKFGDRLGLQGQSILLYEKEERKIPESIQKLIRYEFAEFLSEDERLSSGDNHGAIFKNEEISELRNENEDLKARVKDAEHLKEHNLLLKRTIELLEDQVKMYKNILGEEDKSKTA